MEILWGVVDVTCTKNGAPLNWRMYVHVHVHIYYIAKWIQIDSTCACDSSTDQTQEFCITYYNSTFVSTHMHCVCTCKHTHVLYVHMQAAVLVCL